MSKQPEFYPMPSFPILAVNDVLASSRWYQEALGFAHVFAMPGPGGAPGLAHLRWAKYADLLLRLSPPLEGKRGLGITLNFAILDRTVAAVDALAERASKHGGVVTQAPGDRPWNARDFTVADPDGYALTFTFGPLNRDMTMDALASKMSRS
ncbi:MAG: VOC family protein [Rhizomicrobium sp.]